MKHMIRYFLWMLKAVQNFSSDAKYVFEILEIEIKYCKIFLHYLVSIFQEEEFTGSTNDKMLKTQISALLEKREEAGSEDEVICRHRSRLLQ